MIYHNISLLTTLLKDPLGYMIPLMKEYGRLQYLLSEETDSSIRIPMIVKKDKIELKLAHLRTRLNSIKSREEVYYEDKNFHPVYKGRMNVYGLNEKYSGLDGSDNLVYLEMLSILLPFDSLVSCMVEPYRHEIPLRNVYPSSIFDENSGESLYGFRYEIRISYPKLLHGLKLTSQNLNELNYHNCMSYKVCTDIRESFSQIFREVVKDCNTYKFSATYRYSVFSHRNLKYTSNYLLT